MTPIRSFGVDEVEEELPLPPDPQVGPLVPPRLVRRIQERYAPLDGYADPGEGEWLVARALAQGVKPREASIALRARLKGNNHHCWMVTYVEGRQVGAKHRNLMHACRRGVAESFVEMREYGVTVKELARAEASHINMAHYRHLRRHGVSHAVVMNFYEQGYLFAEHHTRETPDLESIIAASRITSEKDLRVVTAYRIDIAAYVACREHQYSHKACIKTLAKR